MEKRKIIYYGAIAITFCILFCIATLILTFMKMHLKIKATGVWGNAVLIIILFTIFPYLMAKYRIWILKEEPKQENDINSDNEKQE